MRLLSLVVVMAIIYFAYSKRITPGKDSTSAAMQDFEQTAPPSTRPATAAAPAPAASNSNLRAPIDRTRAVLEQVKKRNGNGEF
jgi:hypothetical protein